MFLDYRMAIQMSLQLLEKLWPNVYGRRKFVPWVKKYSEVKSFGEDGDLRVSFGHDGFRFRAI